MVMPVDPQTTGQREGASEWEQAAGAGGGAGRGCVSLGIWLGLPRPDRTVGSDPRVRGVTVQMVITGWGRRVGKGRQSPTRGFPQLAQGHMNMTQT